MTEEAKRREKEKGVGRIENGRESKEKEEKNMRKRQH